MKRLVLSIISTALFLSSLSLPVVAVDTDIKAASRQQALEAALSYVEGGGIDLNVSVDGADLSNLQVRDIVFEAFMPTMVDNNLTLQDKDELPDRYTAVVWSNNVPCTLLSIKRGNDGAMKVYGSTAGNVDVFAERLETMRNMTVDGEVSCISMYNRSNYYFHGKTSDGYSLIPMIVSSENKAKLRKRYTDNIVISEDIFTVASREHIAEFREGADAGLMGGGKPVEEFLPIDKEKTVLPLALAGLFLIAVTITLILLVKRRKATKSN